MSDGTFYPPYSWKIAKCSKCGHQVGWHFHDNVLENPSFKAVSDKTSNGGSNSAQSPKLVPDPSIASKTEQQIVDEALAGVCLTYPKGWWQYQWCHRKEIRQFHEESGKRTMDWSLGKFDKTGKCI